MAAAPALTTKKKVFCNEFLRIHELKLKRVATHKSNNKVSLCSNDAAKEFHIYIHFFSSAVETDVYEGTGFNMGTVQVSYMY